MKDHTRFTRNRDSALKYSTIGLSQTESDGITLEFQWKSPNEKTSNNRCQLNKQQLNPICQLSLQFSLIFLVF